MLISDSICIPRGPSHFASLAKAEARSSTSRLLAAYSVRSRSEILNATSTSEPYIRDGATVANLRSKSLLSPSFLFFRPNLFACC